MPEDRNEFACINLVLHAVARNLDESETGNARCRVDFGPTNGHIERQHDLSHTPLYLEVEWIGLT